MIGNYFHKKLETVHFDLCIDYDRYEIISWFSQQTTKYNIVNFIFDKLISLINL